MTDRRDAALAEIERLGQVWHKRGLLDGVSPAHADWLLATLEGHKATLERHAPCCDPDAPVHNLCVGHGPNCEHEYDPWPCPDAAHVLSLYTGAEPQ